MQRASRRMYLMDLQSANARMVTLAMEFYAQVNHIGSMMFVILL
jgi:hypothetical protein